MPKFKLRVEPTLVRFPAGVLRAAMLGLLLMWVGMMGMPLAHGAASAQSAEMVTIRQLVIGPSAILSTDEIASIRAAYEGTTVPAERLLQILEEIDLLYFEKGYVAKAVFPEQTSADGTLKVQLVEARVGQIALAGNDSTRAGYVLDRLGLSPGDLLDVGRVDEAITYFNRMNDVKLQAQLAPGASFGTTDVIVFVQEPQRNQYYIALNPAVAGPLVTSFTWQNGSLRGVRDGLSTTVVTAPGLWSGTVTYNVPVGRRGTRVGLAHSANEFNVLDGADPATAIKRRISQTSINLSQPLAVTATTASLGSLAWQAKTINLFVADVLLSELTNGSLTVAHTLESHASRQAWTFTQGLRAGAVQVGSFEFVPFYKYSATGQNTWIRSSGSRWILRGALQYPVGHSVPDDEDFSLGGLSTVRGFKEGVLSGDGGFFTALEYRWTVSGGSEVFAFVDHGGVTQYGQATLLPADEQITSIGVGADMRPFPSTRVSLVFALPLGNANADTAEPFTVQINIAF